ncbi:MAG: BON domain-containing protein [Gammaproteobacteria bacterium]|nr:BON domain-containing protein [Gammaproteobacteria bacterium]
MKKIAILLAVVPLLSACVPTALVAGATAGGAVVYDNRSMGTMWQDNNTSYQAQILINNDKELKDKANISVAVFDHVVLLVGQAPTKELRDHAQTLIKTVPNIKRICNQITIGQPISASATSNDAWITTKVKSAMLGKKGLSSTQLKVVTEAGVVYLMGLTTPSQGKLAAEVARKVDGVKKVVKVFEYVH